MFHKQRVSPKVFLEGKSTSGNKLFTVVLSVEELQESFMVDLTHVHLFQILKINVDYFIMTKNGFFHSERKQRTPGKVPDKVTRHSLHWSYYPRLKQLAAFWEPWSTLEETLL